MPRTTYKRPCQEQTGEHVRESPNVNVGRAREGPRQKTRTVREKNGAAPYELRDLPEWRKQRGVRKRDVTILVGV